MVTDVNDEQPQAMKVISTAATPVHIGPAVDTDRWISSPLSKRSANGIGGIEAETS